VRSANLTHRLFVRTATLQWSPRLGPSWRRAHAAAIRRWGDTEVTTTLHGRSASINFANGYPISIRRFPNYNAPFVELVARTSQALGRPVRVVDVGAAVGDTALLLLDRCGASLLSLDCIEGEDRFFPMLVHNLAGSIATPHHVMLSDDAEHVPSLVRSQHQGTASAEGSTEVRATTLDSLLGGAGLADVLKVDTDGFDGKVLGGATQLLRASRPSVLFEWHPGLCRRVGTDDGQAFSVLRAADYTRYIFFTKFGQFSHFGDEHLDKLRKLCLTSETLSDWHFDVAALHAGSPVDDIALSDLGYWGGSGWGW
jgi:FkbM family methyltransferase